MTGKAYLDELGPVVAKAREIRHMRVEAFDDCTTDELDLAARALRAVAYSCDQGARLLDRARRIRTAGDEPAVERYDIHKRSSGDSDGRA